MAILEGPRGPNHRIGLYSQIFNYRMATPQASNDSAGNYMINLSRGSIFSDTGDLPNVQDASIETSNPSANTGNDQIVKLGYDATSTGISETYFLYNLSDVYFDNLATPISAIFEVQLASGTQNINPIEVSLYACNEFDELTINQITPVCSATEAVSYTHLTLPTTPYV